MNRSRLFTSTLSVSSLRLIGQTVTLGSGLLIANFFGATAATDDYYTALILPGMLANLVINALMNLFAPIYLQYVTQDDAERDRIFSSLLSVVGGLLLVGAVICVAAVPVFTAVRDLPDADAASRALVFGFVLVLNCPLVGFTRLLTVYSETNQHYSLPAAVAVISPFVFMGTLLLALPLGTFSLMLANLASGVFELVTLGWFVRRRLGVTLRPRLTLHPAVREMLRLSLTSGVAYLALMFVPLIDRVMATSLDAGSLTAFHYGERLVVAFELMVMGGVLIVIYNYWANVHAAQGMPAVAQRVPEMISLLLFVSLPLAVCAALLSRPLMSILFEHGAFTAVEQSAGVFALLMLGVTFQFMIVLCVRLLLLIEQVRLQFIMSLWIVALNTLLNIAFIGPLGLNGIALSTLITRAFVAGLGLYFIWRLFAELKLIHVAATTARTAACLALMAAVVAVLNNAMSPALMREYGILAQMGSTALIAFTALGAYLLAARLIRHESLSSLLSVIDRSRSVSNFSATLPSERHP